MTDTSVWFVSSYLRTERRNATGLQFANISEVWRDWSRTEKWPLLSQIHLTPDLRLIRHKFKGVVTLEQSLALQGRGARLFPKRCSVVAWPILLKGDTCTASSDAKYNLQNNTTKTTNQRTLPNLEVGCSCRKKNTWSDAMSIAYREMFVPCRFEVTSVFSKYSTRTRNSRPFAHWLVHGSLLGPPKQAAQFFSTLHFIVGEAALACNSTKKRFENGGSNLFSLHIIARSTW